MPNMNGIKRAEKKAYFLMVFQDCKTFLNFKFRELKCQSEIKF